MNKTNGDEPINPTTVTRKAYYADVTAAAMLPEFETIQLNGLTKREYFAAMAMQGFIAKYGTEWCAAHAVESADGLIEVLNKVGE